jgi:hypothetical protein
MALIIRNVYNDFITCPSLSEGVGIRFSVRNIRDFHTTHTSFSHNTCMCPVHCALAANEKCNVNIFDKSKFWLIW